MSSSPQTGLAKLGASVQRLFFVNFLLGSVCMIISFRQRHDYAALMLAEVLKKSSFLSLFRKGGIAFKKSLYEMQSH